MYWVSMSTYIYKYIWTIWEQTVLEGYQGSLCAQQLNKDGAELGDSNQASLELHLKAMIKWL